MSQKQPGKTSRGDVWRVTLDVEAAQDMAWVVVSDPIPGGARILGDGDGRDSRIDARGDAAIIRDGLADLRRAQLRRFPRLLRPRPQGPLRHQLHGAPQQRRRLLPSRYPRRSHVRRKSSARCRTGGWWWGGTEVSSQAAPPLGHAGRLDAPGPGGHPLGRRPAGDAPNDDGRGLARDFLLGRRAGRSGPEAGGRPLPSLRPHPFAPGRRKTDTAPAPWRRNGGAPTLPRETDHEIHDEL